MTEEEFNDLTPKERADAWFTELGQMLQKAQQDILFRADNEETIVLPGLTTIVAEREGDYR
jgi:hypothetical protein